MRTAEHPTTTDASTARQGRSRAASVVTGLVVGAPLAMAVGVAVHPHDTSDAGATLARIAGEDRGLWTLAHVLEPFAWLLVGAVLFLASRLGPPGRRKLVRAGGVLGAVGAAATALIVYGHGEAYLHMTAPGIDLAAMEPLYDRFYAAMPLAGPLSLGFRLGLLLLGIGLFQVRAVPRWAAVLLALVPVIMAPLATAPALVVAVVGVGPLVAALAGSAPAIAASLERPAAEAMPST